MKKYFPINSYSMKCQIYPNVNQEKRMDLILDAIRIIWNKSLYDMIENKLWSKEKKDKNGDGIVHFPDFNALKKADNYNQYVLQDSRLNIIPKASLSGKANSIFDAMKKAWETTGKYPIEKWGTYINKEGKKKYRGVKYIGKSNPVSSFFFQSRSMNVIPTDDGYKKNAFKLTVPNVKYGRRTDEDYVSGEVTVKGHNKNIKFENDMDFLEWIQTKPQVSVRVTKDNCGDWYAVFNFVTCYKPMDVAETGVIGVDVGEKTLATLDDGTKYDNIYDHCPEYKEIEKLLKYYDKKLSRSEGWKNIKFREKHKLDKTLKPSKTYIEYDKKKKKLERKKVRIRRDYYHKVPVDLFKRANTIGVEGLKAGDMIWQKESTRRNKITHKHNKNIMNAAMSDFLTILKYKAEWYINGTTVVDQYFPSTKKCSCCGYVNYKINNTSIRKWTCPECGAKHDRDINAAINLRNEAIRMNNV